MICPFCNNEAEWVENKEIYGKNFGKSYMIWLCRPCKAYVGCHNNTKEPLGTMANNELRKLRVIAHDKFDIFWRTGYMQRKEAYKYLQKIMHLKHHEAHIAKFNKEQCLKLIQLLNK